MSREEDLELIWGQYQTQLEIVDQERAELQAAQEAADDLLLLYTQTYNVEISEAVRTLVPQQERTNRHIVYSQCGKAVVVTRQLREYDADVVHVRCNECGENIPVATDQYLDSIGYTPPAATSPEP